MFPYTDKTEELRGRYSKSF